MEKIEKCNGSHGVEKKNDPLWDRYQASTDETKDGFAKLTTTLAEFELAIRKLLNGHYVDTNESK